MTFIEQNKLACETLKKNLDQLSLNNKATLINDNVENIFLKIKNLIFFSLIHPLQIINISKFFLC